MNKLVLAMLSFALEMQAARDQNHLLAAYWFLVMLYWLWNFGEGKK